MAIEHPVDGRVLWRDFAERERWPLRSGPAPWQCAASDVYVMDRGSARSVSPAQQARDVIYQFEKATVGSQEGDAGAGHPKRTAVLLAVCRRGGAYFFGTHR